VRVFAAVDLGASSGRVMAGFVDGDEVRVEPVHRFPNGVAESGGHLRWDLTRLHEEVLAGLARVREAESIGIDTWGVDYGLLDEEGALLAEPIAHRDGRTDAVIDAVHALVPPEELFAVNGLQFLPFTTLYQLVAEQRGPLWERAAHVALIPDLLAHRLTGELRTERTNASTTGLVDVRSGTWSTDLLDRLAIPAGLLPPLEDPGTVRGCTGGGTPVTTVGSHDTASAVVAVPATTSSFAYVVSGTWSLVGLELAGPVVTPEARIARFTNEAGVDGRTRFLRNVGGLWLLQECLRAWDLELGTVLAQAAARAAGGPTFDVDDPAFIAPGGMPDRIAASVAAAGGPPLRTSAEITRCIVDSLACAYAVTIERAAELTGTQVDVVHVVGGGAQNELLCQLTADRTGRPVVAGPVEATALGNVVVQARAHGAAPPSLEALRAAVAAASELRRYVPR
jgi:rhamnulokinase